MSTTTNSPLTADDWSCACHLTIGGAGSVILLQHRGGHTRTVVLPQAPASGLDEARRPALLGIAPDQSAILLDPVSRRITTQTQLPVDAVPVYAYSDGSPGFFWLVCVGVLVLGVVLVCCVGLGALF